MKKLLFSLCMASLLFACTKTDQLTNATEIDALSEAYDNSNFGNYKGVFTTLDSETRAVVDVTITPNGAKATLTTEAGQVHEFYSMTEIVQGEVTDVTFEGADGSFNFEVGGDGSDVAITKVMYLDEPGDILAKKNTAKAPASPVTGTYNCTNCEAGQAADAHPNFIDNSTTETFSFIFAGAPGSQNIETQITYNTVVYTDLNAGTEGTENPNLGNITTADTDLSDGMVTISGMSTVIANVDWEGTHMFNGSSSISGFWDFETGGYVMTGVFQATEGSLSLPFIENFDETGAGSSGSCGASPLSCTNLKLPANGQWFIEGDARGLANNDDHLRVVSNALRARDLNNELCFKSKVINIATAASVDFSVDVFETGTHEVSDYVEVNLIIDGVSTPVQTLTGDFTSQTVTSSGISGSELQIEICILNDVGTELINIDNLSVEAN